MKRSLLSLILLAVVVFAGIGCGSVTPNPGEEVVLVRYPSIFKFIYNGGVDPTPIKSGREFIAWTTQSYTVDVKPVLYTMRIDDMFSRDNVPLDFNASMTLRVTNSVKMVEKFGVQKMDLGGGVVVPAWYWNNVYKPWERSIREAVKNYGMTELVADADIAGGTSSTIKEIDKSITASMESHFRDIGLPAELSDMTVGRATPPDEIKAERVATASQDQRSNTEKRRKLAEDQRKEAENSRAAADNAYRLQMQLSPDQFLQLEQIKAWEKMAEKGNATFFIGVGGPTPTINVGKSRPAAAETK